MHRLLQRITRLMFVQRKKTQFTTKKAPFRKRHYKMENRLRDKNFEIYKSKRVLVTGHTGFKGSWMTLWLKELGAQVFGYALPPPTNPSLFEFLNLEKEINHEVGDIRDIDRLKKCLLRTKPDIIFHLAAQSLVGKSYEDP